MASVIKRSGSWQAKIKRKGYPVIFKTFVDKADAQLWARKIEYQMDSGSWVDNCGTRSTLINTMISDWITRQKKEFGLNIAKPKLSQLNGLSRWFENKCIHTLTEKEVRAFILHRRKTICGSTMQQQLGYLIQVINESKIKLEVNVAQNEYKTCLTKRLVHGSVSRQRILFPGEYERLVETAKNLYWTTKPRGLKGQQRCVPTDDANMYMIDHIDLAITSAMRQGEIHALKWEDINWEAGIILVLRKDKTSPEGKRLCKIPMVVGVREVLLRVWNKRSKPTGGSLWPMVHSARTVSNTFADITKAAGIDDLRYHDLRHEALTRIAQYIREPFKLQQVSGHKDVNELMTYINGAPEALVADFAMESVLH